MKLKRKEYSMKLVTGKSEITDNLKAELASWNVEDPKIRSLKLEREWVRYPQMVEHLGIKNLLNLHEKDVLDIGCGPMGGLLNIVECNTKTTLDPLNYKYLEQFPEFYNSNISYVTGVAEAMPFPNNTFDLIISTNAFDHVDNPHQAMKEMRRVLKPGGYIAIIFCLNLSKIHPHPSHIHSINEEIFRSWVDDKFETIKHEVIRYGWVKYNNKVGQPALVWLGRSTEMPNE